MIKDIKYFPLKCGWCGTEGKVMYVENHKCEANYWCEACEKWRNRGIYVKVTTGSMVNGKFMTYEEMGINNFLGIPLHDFSDSKLYKSENHAYQASQEKA